ncbi:MAG: NRDE family protein [Steroidobacteraceae bacterium]
MCLLVVAWRVHPRYRLIVAANRDEYHDRPAAPLSPWLAPAELLAGRDLRAGGTWLGIDRNRRFGVITNYHEGQRAPQDAPTRGGLIPGYLTGLSAAGDYLGALETDAGRYGGFNLLLADSDSLWYGSNRAAPFARRLEAGVYGLSNHQLDSPWPKLIRVRGRFEHWLRATAGAADEPQALLEILADRRPAGDEAAAPAGGVLSAEDRALSAPFVAHRQFGTRCSTVLLLESSGALRMCERRFDRLGRPAGFSDYRLASGQWCSAEREPAPSGTVMTDYNENVRAGRPESEG